jgi:hypothetical protein
VRLRNLCGGCFGLALGLLMVGWACSSM